MLGMCPLGLKAGVAQWQSSGFVNRRSRVRIPSPAPQRTLYWSEFLASLTWADHDLLGNLRPQDHIFPSHV